MLSVANLKTLLSPPVPGLDRWQVVARLFAGVVLFAIASASYALYGVCRFKASSNAAAAAATGTVL